MAEMKTKPHAGNVLEFLEKEPQTTRKNDCLTLIKTMQAITGEEPKMWGPSIVGFGVYHYRYETGREGQSFLTGFSPRKQALTIYIMAGFENYEALMSRLGKFKTGKACLYVKKLADIDMDLLKELITHSIEYVKAKSVDP